MDEFTRDLELMEVISASDAVNNAITIIRMRRRHLTSDQWEAIRRYVLPLLGAEHARLDVEYRRLQD